MQDVEIVKSDDQELLYAIRVNNTVFTSMDVFYTISQKYRETLVFDNVRINKNYPMSTMPLSLCEGDTEAVEALGKSGADIYFDAIGLFIFKDEANPNPDRAAKEFMQLAEEQRVVMGPNLVIAQMELDELIMHEQLGGGKVLFMYKD